jgi:hypothetical protein
MEAENHPAEPATARHATAWLDILVRMRKFGARRLDESTGFEDGKTVFYLRHFDPPES